MAAFSDMYDHGRLQQEDVMQTTMKDIRSSTTIHAPIERVWTAITTPSEMKQWFFGVDTEADWRPGGRLIHRGEYQGKAYVDKGEILEFDPPHRLVHTHWSDVSGLPDAPEHYHHEGIDDVRLPHFGVYRANEAEGAAGHPGQGRPQGKGEGIDLTGRNPHAGGHVTVLHHGANLQPRIGAIQ